jgi:hypothetical protein
LRPALKSIGPDFGRRGHGQPSALGEALASLFDHLAGEGRVDVAKKCYQLNVVLAIVPTPPRPIVSRLVARATERLDERDGDADLESKGTEQDEEPEVDDGP